MSDTATKPTLPAVLLSNESIASTFVGAIEGSKTTNNPMFAMDFYKTPFSGIPLFSGKDTEIVTAFLTSVESVWSEYQLLQIHWIPRLRESFLVGEALKVANDFQGRQWTEFCAYMNKWFPPTLAKMRLRYMMVNQASYLIGLDMRQAIAQAQRDYEAQGADYDAPEPAGHIAMRIPRDIQCKHNFLLYEHTSGRKILELIGAIVHRERQLTSNNASWLVPLTTPTKAYNIKACASVSRKAMRVSPFAFPRTEIVGKAEGVVPTTGCQNKQPDPAAVATTVPKETPVLLKKDAPFTFKSGVVTPVTPASTSS